MADFGVMHTTSPLVDVNMAVEQWSEQEVARRQRLVEQQAIELGPPTPSHAERRRWRQGASGRPERVTVVVEDVHITYRVYEDRKPKARDRFVRRGAREFREIKAVRGVSFKAHAGEAIGIIGRNGSGKSTLLQGMAGLLPVNEGRILAHSQPSLLGVGAVLQPGLSGRRNIMLGTLALGMTKAEAEAQVDKITEFAGLEEYIDLPMRTYSSGMKARLHFSIATSVIPEILMIDEALAVGDEVFKRRSDERIRELQDAAGTIFIVSHGLEGIIDTCTRVIWLEKGHLIADGDPKEVVSRYRAEMADEVQRDRKRRGKGKGRNQGGGGGGGGRGGRGGGGRGNRDQGRGQGQNRGGQGGGRGQGGQGGGQNQNGSQGQNRAQNPKRGQHHDQAHPHNQGQRANRGQNQGQRQGQGPNRGNGGGGSNGDDSDSIYRRTGGGGAADVVAGYEQMNSRRGNSGAGPMSNGRSGGSTGRGPHNSGGQNGRQVTMGGQEATNGQRRPYR